MKNILLLIVLIVIVGLFFMYQDTNKKFESMKVYINNDKAWSKDVSDLALERGRPYAVELSIAASRAMEENVWLSLFTTLGLIKIDSL